MSVGYVPWFSRLPTTRNLRYLPLEEDPDHGGQELLEDNTDQEDGDQSRREEDDVPDTLQDSLDVDSRGWALLVIAPGSGEMGGGEGRRP